MTTETVTDTATTVDSARAEEFAQRLFGTYTAGMLTYMIDIGNRTGLFDAAAAGPATSAELAERAGLQERYVREWLGALTTGGIFSYDPLTRTYTLPAEHAACLSGDDPANVAPLSRLVSHLAKHVTATWSTCPPPRGSTRRSRSTPSTSRPTPNASCAACTTRWHLAGRSWCSTSRRRATCSTTSTTR